VHPSALTPHRADSTGRRAVTGIQLNPATTRPSLAKKRALCDASQEGVYTTDLKGLGQSSCNTAAMLDLPEQPVRSGNADCLHPVRMPQGSIVAARATSTWPLTPAGLFVQVCATHEEVTASTWQPGIRRPACG
jgi:hypothetical protein